MISTQRLLAPAEGSPARLAELAPEGELARAVIDTLLREDYGGLSHRVRATAGGPVLDLPGDHGLVLPLRADGFLADFRIARTGPALGLGDVAAALEVISDGPDADGVAAFGAECRDALAALVLRRRHLPGALGQADAGSWLGYGGAVRYDALAAALPHPAYPTSASRLGFTDSDSLRYAPEYLPEFELNWVAMPRTAVEAAGRGRRGWPDRPDRPAWWPHMPATGRDRPSWWPDMPAVGLAAGLAATHELMPVHPVTAREALAGALAEARSGMIAPGQWLRVRPTLSTRTVAVADCMATHLKLPLPVSTLGLLNRRALKPGTLADGALVGRVLAETAARDTGLDGLLLADDGDFAHAGHPCLGYLRRRLPGGLEQSRIVPVAALLAPMDGGVVLDELARDGFGGDPLACFGAYLDLLFGVQVRLFARYGIALESHQQNASVVLGRGGLRLLVKDFDGALINHGRLAAALEPASGPVPGPLPGPAAPDPSRFADPRLLTDSDDALADVFITITVHLCAGAIAFGLADRGYAPRAELLAMVRRALTAALDRHAGVPAARVLRDRVLAADRLPGKAMVTAGTLRDKSRTGARDINKFYGTTGPNYLRTYCG